VSVEWLALGHRPDEYSAVADNNIYTKFDGTEESSRRGGHM
jgi:hypothetical protein